MNCRMIQSVGTWGTALFLSSCGGAAETTAPDDHVSDVGRLMHTLHTDLYATLYQESSNSAIKSTAVRATLLDSSCATQRTYRDDIQTFKVGVQCFEISSNKLTCDNHTISITAANVILQADVTNIGVNSNFQLTGTVSTRLSFDGTVSGPSVQNEYVNCTSNTTIDLNKLATSHDLSVTSCRCLVGTNFVNCKDLAGGIANAACQ